MGPIAQFLFIYLYYFCLQQTRERIFNVDFLWEELGSIIKPQNSFRNKDIISIGVDMNNKHISPT